MTRRQRLLEWPYWQQVIGGAWAWANAFGIYRRHEPSTTLRALWRRLRSSS